MHVVLVHGYLAPKAILWPLSRGLRRLGHRTETFGYPSHRGKLAEHTRRLTRLLEGRNAPLALIGHSLGGLLIHAVVRAHPELPVDRRVFIATPHQGSKAMRGALKTPLGRFISEPGRLAARGLAPPAHPSPIGVIVGTRDRTVSVREARLAEAADVLELPYTHNELMMRPQTLHAVDRFLRHARFEAPLDLELRR